MAVFTIGYEGIGLEDFLGLLSENGIDTLIDIREYPLSRKPGFSKTVLNATVGLMGLDYRHIKALGCPKEVRNKYRDTGDWTQYKRGFLSYLDTQTEVIRELAEFSASSNFALMCFEADYNYCHRSMVANAVAKLSSEKVFHIASDRVRIKQSDLQGVLPV